MPFDEDAFVEKIIRDFSYMQANMESFRALTAEQRRSVIQKVLNKLINIPTVPEFVEAWMFGFAVESLEGFLKSKLFTSPAP